MVRNRNRTRREVQLPRQIRDLPDKPANGNYILLTVEPEGYGNWTHAESLAEVYGEFRRGHGHCPFKRKLEGLVLLDATDDFVIHHMDGSVRATKIDKVFGSGCYEEQAVRE